MDTELKNKYSTVDDLITQKAGGVSDAKKRAERLQQEAKDLLLQASDKLQLLKGTDQHTHPTDMYHEHVMIMHFEFLNIVQGLVLFQAGKLSRYFKPRRCYD